MLLLSPCCLVRRTEKPDIRCGRLQSTSALLALILTAASSPALAAPPAPDLSLTLIDSGTVYEQAYSKVSLIVKNQGTGSAPEIIFSYAPGAPVFLPLTPGYSVSPIERGHSGRGGGYTRVGWTVAQTSPVPLAPKHSAVIQLDALYPLGTYNESWAVSSGTPPQLNLVSHSVADTVVCLVPPVPSAPQGLGVSQSGDSLALTWHPPSIGAAAVTSSILTAVPTALGSGTLVATGTGNATTGSIPGVEPSTIYSVTVQSKDAAGTGPSSAPALFTTHAATIVPSPPTGVHAWWSSDLIVAWVASVPGNSPVDDYEVSATSSDGGPPVLVSAGSSTEISLSISSGVDFWQLKVRAHNAAGWGDWSAAITQAGL
jgi:hypothetical protein